jgi:two-component system CheB/CheR fusion protein
MNPLRPDAAEEGSERLDDAIPSRGYGMTPVVALGGARGVAAAVRGFFETVRTGAGIAYLVIGDEGDHGPLHDELAAAGKLKVVRVDMRAKMEPDHVYLLPSARPVRSMDGYVVLDPQEREGASAVAVDQLLRTLADTHGAHAAAVVLSGDGADGAIGVKRIKERGGLTLAQDPDEAELGSMPRAANATGIVDWVLPVRDMPARLGDYRRFEGELKLPPETPATGIEAERNSDAVDEAALREVLVLLRTRTGRDFSQF